MSALSTICKVGIQVSRPQGLVCPLCYQSVVDGVDFLHCPGCARRYPIENDVANLLVEESFSDIQRETHLAWEEQAEIYHQVIGGIEPARLLVIDRPLLRIVRGDVLEVGCGDGRLLAKIAKQPVRSVTGIDISPRMLRPAVENGHMVATASAEQLPFPANSFDSVVSGYYSLRFADLDRALGEIARVLRPGGWFAFTLLSGCTVGIASRIAGVRSIFQGGDLNMGLRIALEKVSGARMEPDPSSAGALRSRIHRAGLSVREILGTPFIPIGRQTIHRLTGGNLPYLWGNAAIRFGFDVIIVGMNPHTR